jgi:hypothetical protein
MGIISLLGVMTGVHTYMMYRLELQPGMFSRCYFCDFSLFTAFSVLRNLLAKEDHVRTLCFSHDGKYLATSSWDRVIFVSLLSKDCRRLLISSKVWEINTKYVRNAFKGHTRRIVSLNFSPNDRLLLSASYDNSVRLWNTHDGTAKFLTEDNPTYLDDPCYSSAVFSPDGTYVAASHHDGVVRLWGVRTGQLIGRVKAHMNWAYDVSFMPDGKSLVSGGWDNTLKYWDISSLVTTRFCAVSKTAKDSDREAPPVEEQTRLEREFSGHTVRRLYSVSCSLMILPFSSNRILSAHFPSLLMGDGLLPVLMMEPPVSGTPAVRQRNVFSTLTTGVYGQLILVQQAGI